MNLPHESIRQMNDWISQQEKKCGWMSDWFQSANDVWLAEMNDCRMAWIINPGINKLN